MKTLALALFSAAAALAHDVPLNWVAATDFAVGDTYRIYRSTGACPAGGPTGVFASGITGITFDDTSVVAGQTYCYAATHVRTSDGVESVQSNTFTAIIPTDVAPPTGLTGHPK